MSEDKYPSIFSPQMEAIVFTILQIFYATRAVFRIGEYPRIFPSFSWGNIRPLDELRSIARERKYLMDYKRQYTRYGGGVVLPYMGYIGMCGPKGYGFSAVLVINRVSILADFGHFGHK